MAHEEFIARFGCSELFEEVLTDDQGLPVTGGSGTITITGVDGATLASAVSAVSMPEVGATGVHRYTITPGLLTTEGGEYLAVTILTDGTYTFRGTRTIRCKGDAR